MDLHPLRAICPYDGFVFHRLSALASCDANYCSHPTAHLPLSTISRHIHSAHCAATAPRRTHTPPAYLSAHTHPSAPLHLHALPVRTHPSALTPRRTHPRCIYLPPTPYPQALGANPGGKSNEKFSPIKFLPTNFRNLHNYAKNMKNSRKIC